LAASKSQALSPSVGPLSTFYSKTLSCQSNPLLKPKVNKQLLPNSTRRTHDNSSVHSPLNQEKHSAYPISHYLKKSPALQSSSLIIIQENDESRGGRSMTPYNCSSPSSLPSAPHWCPPRMFQIVRSNQPLDLACNAVTLQQVKRKCKQPIDTVVAWHPEHQMLVVTTKELRDLMSYSSPINDTIMTFYMEKLTKHSNISYITTAFLYTLRAQGWARLETYFALHRNRPRTNSRPYITGESAVILPCFVDNCHWVAVVCREVHGSTIFLYAVDLNSPTTETDIKTLCCLTILHQSFIRHLPSG
jgi:hypothetical protein